MGLFNKQGVIKHISAYQCHAGVRIILVSLDADRALPDIALSSTNSAMIRYANEPDTIEEYLYEAEAPCFILLYHTQASDKDCQQFIEQIIGIDCQYLEKLVVLFESMSRDTYLFSQQNQRLAVMLDKEVDSYDSLMQFIQDNVGKIDNNQSKPFSSAVNLATEATKPLEELHKNLLIDKLPYLIAVINDQNTVIQWNKAAATLSEIPEEQAIGCNLFLLLKQAKYIRSLIERAHLGQSHVDQIVHIKLNNKEDHVFSTSVISMPCSETGKNNVLITLNDITDALQQQRLHVSSESSVTIATVTRGIAQQLLTPISVLIQGIQNIDNRLSATIEKNLDVAKSLQLNFSQMQAYCEQRKIFKFSHDITQAAGLVLSMVSELLSYDNDEDLQIIRINVRTLVDEALLLVAKDNEIKQLRKTQVATFDVDITQHTSIDIPCYHPQLVHGCYYLIKYACLLERAEETPPTFSENIRIIVRKFKATIQIKIVNPSVRLNEDNAEDLFTSEIRQPKDSKMGFIIAVSNYIITRQHQGTISVLLGEHSTEIILTLPFNKYK